MLAHCLVDDATFPVAVLDGPRVRLSEVSALRRVLRREPDAGGVMAWVFVVLGGLFETAFAMSLKYSDGFSRLWPTLSFTACAVISFVLLTLGLRDLPVGTAYAVWTGIGAVGTAAVGMIWLEDPTTVVRIGSILLIVAGIVGLRLAGTHAVEQASGSAVDAASSQTADQPKR